MTVYVDSLFLLNAVVNGLLLAGTARLGGAPLYRRRLSAAAALGGVYAAAAVALPLDVLHALPVKLLVMALMTLWAFGPGRAWLRLTALFFLLSAAFGGLVLVMANVLGLGLLVLSGTAYYPVSGRALLLTAAAVYVLARVVLSRLTQHAGGELVPILLTAGGKSARLTALRDTGNTLKDPLTNRGVVVADWQVARALLPSETAAGLTGAQFARPAELLPVLSTGAAGRCWRLIPYKTVGVAGGLLLAMRCDSIQIGKRTLRGALVAFSPTSVSDGGVYSALIGGAI